MHGEQAHVQVLIDGSDSQVAMLWPIYLVSFGIPATYLIEVLCGIVLRGAGLGDLSGAIVGLSICCVVILLAAVSRFRIRVA